MDFDIVTYRCLRTVPIHHSASSKKVLGILCTIKISTPVDENEKSQPRNDGRRLNSLIFNNAASASIHDVVYLSNLMRKLDL